MSLDPDARDFVRKYLADPGDGTARLVFADWLEETGQSWNRAWAYFIRLRVELVQHAPGSPEWKQIAEQLAYYVPRVHARLTIPAATFLKYPRSLLDLLPAANIRVRLARCVVPPPVVESMPWPIAHDGYVFPLQRQNFTTIAAAVYDGDAPRFVARGHLRGRDVIAVAADPDDLRDAIARHYGATVETPTVDFFSSADW